MTRERAAELLSGVTVLDDPEMAEAHRVAISALRKQEQSGKNLLRSVQVIKYTCGAGTPEEAETNCTYFIRGECTSSFCEYRRKKQTNADRIRNMNDEELAEFIKHIKIRAAFCKAVKGNDAFEALCSAEWLQQPTEEDDHDA